MLQPTRFRGPSLSPTTHVPAKKTKSVAPSSPTNLNDDELRKRIFANAAVLFPSGSTQPNAYEIVYGMQARRSSAESNSEASLRYAMLVRRGPSGEFAPLLRGQLSSSTAPWSTVLQSLLDSTAAAIHKRLGCRELPPLGVSEELPRYSPAVAVVVGVSGRSGQAS